jgi:hypothetical protein
MKDSIAKALNEADWEDMIPKLVNFAYKHMCYILADFEHSPVINGYNPKTLTQEAIKRTIEGSRHWNPDKVTLLGFLFGVIRSITDCEMKKHCAVVLAHPTTDENGKVSDPAENVPDDAPTPEHVTDASLIVERQRAFLDAFILTIEDDEELSCLTLAMMEGHLMPEEISVQTGIPANRVSNLKPKLRGKMEAFAGANPIPLEKNFTLMEI